MPFPINEKYIQQAEQQLGFIFPMSFKSKMQQLNGGEVIADDDQWQLFPFFDQADKKRINRTCNHILYETKQAQHWIGFPAHAIAIASNGAGDLLILQKTIILITSKKPFIAGYMKRVKVKSLINVLIS